MDGGREFHSKKPINKHLTRMASHDFASVQPAFGALSLVSEVA